MFNLPRSLWGQTALMLVVIAIVLACLRGFTSRHYFTHYSRER